jgi:hypothetical protein
MFLRATDLEQLVFVQLLRKVLDVYVNGYFITIPRSVEKYGILNKFSLFKWMEDVEF